MHSWQCMVKSVGFIVTIVVYHLTILPYYCNAHLEAIIEFFVV